MNDNDIVYLFVTDDKITLRRYCWGQTAKECEEKTLRIHGVRRKYRRAKGSGIDGADGTTRSHARSIVL